MKINFPSYFDRFKIQVAWFNHWNKDPKSFNQSLPLELSKWLQWTVFLTIEQITEDAIIESSFRRFQSVTCHIIIF